MPHHCRKIPVNFLHRRAKKRGEKAGMLAMITVAGSVYLTLSNTIETHYLI